MLSQRTQRRESENRRPATASRERGVETESDADDPPFRLGRLLYGGVLAFMAIDNFRNMDERIGYAESKGAPMAESSVPAASAALLGGGVGIALWRLPRLAAVSAASFFAGVTPMMHDFWNQEGQERTQEQFHFLKNVALLGAALAFLSRGGDSD